MRSHDLFHDVCEKFICDQEHLLKVMMHSVTSVTNDVFRDVCKSSWCIQERQWQVMMCSGWCFRCHDAFRNVSDSPFQSSLLILKRLNIKNGFLNVYKHVVVSIWVCKHVFVSIWVSKHVLVSTWVSKRVFVSTWVSKHVVVSIWVCKHIFMSI